MHFPIPPSRIYLLARSYNFVDQEREGCDIYCDAVFEGGGVKGTAFVGAIQETEARGYRFNRVAGTSAGSIIAALICAGYSGEELGKVLTRLQFSSFLKPNMISYIPLLGSAANLLLYSGMYSSDPIETWMEEMLDRKGIRFFGDLDNDQLKIIASDITRGRMLVLPDDLSDYGLDPDRFPIARAVRMSCTIPYFFQPVVVKGGQYRRYYVVDGGLLSNYPVWIFDREEPRWPTFGFRLREKKEESSRIGGPFSMLKALVMTMLTAHDRLRIEERDTIRTIFIPVDGIKSTDFDLSDKEQEELVRIGREEASRFFDRWSYSTYLARYRIKPKT